MKTVRTIAITVVAVLAGAGRLDGGGVAAEDRQARVERLENSLLAPCCWAEPISRHASEISVKMRLEVQNMVNAGKSDEEILGLYEARYGTRVLVPPQRDVWVWSDGIPWLLTGLGAAAVVWLVARWRVLAIAPAPASGAAPLPDVPESDEEWERLDSPRSPTQRT